MTKPSDSLDRYNRRLGQIKRAAHRMWVVYIKFDDTFEPLTDVHGQAVAFTCKKDAGPTLHHQKELLGKVNVYLQKLGQPVEGDRNVATMQESAS